MLGKFKLKTFGKESSPITLREDKPQYGLKIIKNRLSIRMLKQVPERIGLLLIGKFLVIQKVFSDFRETLDDRKLSASGFRKRTELLKIVKS